MSRIGRGGLYKAPTKKKKERERLRGKIRSSLLILDLKDGRL